MQGGQRGAACTAAGGGGAGHAISRRARAGAPTTEAGLHALKTGAALPAQANQEGEQYQTGPALPAQANQEDQ